MLCAKIIEIGSSLLKLFKIKFVTFFETRCNDVGRADIQQFVAYRGFAAHAECLTSQIRSRIECLIPSVILYIVLV